MAMSADNAGASAPTTPTKETTMTFILDAIGFSIFTCGILVIYCL